MNKLRLWLLSMVVAGLFLAACSGDEPVLNLDNQDVNESQLRRHFTNLREGEYNQDWRLRFTQLCAEMQGRDLEEQAIYLANHPEQPTIGIINPSDVILLIGKERPGQQGDAASIETAIAILKDECDEIPFEARAPIKPDPDEPAIEKPMRLFDSIPFRHPVTAPETGRVELGGLVRSMTVSGGHAYVSTDGCIFVIDARDAANPVIRGSVAITGGTQPAGAFDLDKAGDLLYAAVPYGGLHIFDLRDPASPRLVSRADTSLQTQGLTMDFAQGVAVAGGVAYVASTELKLIDVSTPSTPSTLGSLLVFGYGGRLELHEGHAYLPSDHVGYEGFQVVDVSDQAAPAVVAEIPTGASQAGRTDIAFEGSHAFVVGGDHLHVFDISVPAAPRLLASNPLPRTAQHVAIQDGIAVVTIASEFPYGPSMFSGVQIWDVRIPASPVLVGSHEMERPPRVNGKSVLIEGNTVFVVTGQMLHLFDLSDLRRGTP